MNISCTCHLQVLEFNFYHSGFNSATEGRTQKKPPQGKSQNGVIPELVPRYRIRKYMARLWTHNVLSLLPSNCPLFVHLSDHLTNTGQSLLNLVSLYLISLIHCLDWVQSYSNVSLNMPPLDEDNCSCSVLLMLRADLWWQLHYFKCFYWPNLISEQ